MVSSQAIHRCFAFFVVVEMYEINLKVFFFYFDKHLKYNILGVAALISRNSISVVFLQNHFTVCFQIGRK